MISDLLPDIPRAFTGVAEWGACVVYVRLMPGRRRPATVAALLAAGLPVLVGAQVLVGKLPLTLWIVGMAVAVAAMAALVAGCTAAGSLHVGYVVARAFVLAELVASLEWQLHVHLFGAGAPAAAPGSLTMLLFVDGGVFALAHRIERRHFDAADPLETDHRGVLSATAIALITFLMSNLSFVDARTPFSGTVGSAVLYIRTLVDLAGYVALYAQHGQRRESRRAEDLAVLDRLLRQQHEQYLRSKEDIDRVNRRYHDLKHHLVAIRAASDADTRAGYIDDLERSLRGLGVRVRTGHPVLDTVLTAKAAHCAGRDITFTCVVDGAHLGFVGAVDLSALVGNALDNAVEAVDRVAEPDRRQIRVVVRRQDGLVLFEVENCFDGDLVVHDGLPRTTKPDAQDHGYGLRTMRQVAERYGGHLSVRGHDGWFTARVLLPVPPDPGS